MSVNKAANLIEANFQREFSDKGDYFPNDSISGFTKPLIPIISNKNKDIIELYQWMLIPHWSKEENIKFNTLNAKIETLREKASFKAVVQNRCLVITDSFYEWQWLDPKGKSKQKYQINAKGAQFTCMAGLWSDWVSENTGEVKSTFTIVTTEANDFMSEIHNTKKRMPVILDKDYQELWLKGEDIDLFKKLNVGLEAVKA